MDPWEVSVDKLFRAILDTLADTDVFGYSYSPSIFIVYAHDNEKIGTSHASHVVRLIEWLRAIRSRTLSDKFPLPLCSTRVGGTEPIRNILSNQFCLLPICNGSEDRNSIHGVDKVVICGSEVLRQYHECGFATSYIKDIETTYINAKAQSTEAQDFQYMIRNVVEAQCHHDAFHHVLTELAFLNLRRTYIADHGIIPVALDSDLMTYLPFLKNCDLVLKLKSPQKADLHKLFFKLLAQIYAEEHVLVDQFQNCYEQASRRLQGATSTEQKDTDQIIYQQILKTLNNLKRLGSAAYRNGSLEAVIRQLNTNMTRLDDSHQISLRTNFLRELSSVDYRDYKNIISDRVEGTCEWFTNHPFFQQWKDSDISSLLWVSADPGCGKTVLMKYLADEVIYTSSTRTTCYFFFNDGFDKYTNLEVAMRCLLHQLFSQRPTLLSHDILEKFQTDEQFLKSFSSLWGVFELIERHQDSGEIIIILDALDECNESGRARLIKALTKFYKNSQAHRNTVLKFLLTSRPYADIKQDFRELETWRPIIHLSGENPADVEKISQEIDLVIKARVLKTGERLQLQSDEKEYLLKELTRSRNRTYLWAYLVIADINDMRIDITKDRIQAIVNQLPPTVEAAYEKSLNRSPNFTKTLRLLHIIMGAERPLEIQEIAVALGIKEEYKSYLQLNLEPEHRFCTTIRELCGLLVVISSDSKVHLLHQTVREFLITNSSCGSMSCANDSDFLGKWQNSLLQIESHYILAEICILYLELEGRHGRDHGDIFLDYAAKHWPAHFRKARGKNVKKLVPKAERLCDETSTTCVEWLKIYWTTTGHRFPDPRDFPDGFNALMIASYFGLDEVLCLVMKRRNLDLDMFDRLYLRSALSWACENGHDTIVATLFNKLSTVKMIFNHLRGKGTAINSKDYFGRTPLWYAAAHGHTKIVQTLIEKRAKLQLQDEYGQTPLSIAIQNDHQAVVQIFLKMGLSFDNLDNDIEHHVDPTDIPPLVKAALHGQIQAVRFHLNRGTNLETVDEYGQTALFLAAGNGHEVVVQMLLENGANIEARCDMDRTPIMQAVLEKSVGVMLILLENAPNIEARDCDDRTPLLLATACFHREFEDVKVEHFEVVRLLVDQGANIEARDDSGMSSLLLASYCFHKDPEYVKVVRLLVEKGAEIDATDDGSMSPLLWATACGHTELVQLLLEAGADIEATYNDVISPLALARACGHEEVVRLLVEKGGETDATDDNNLSPLLWAIAFADKEIVQLMLEAGADIDAADRDNVTPLGMAAGSGQGAMIQLLLDNGADINTTTPMGRTPLMMAVKTGQERSTQMLLESGANVDDTDDDGMTALILATNSEQEDNMPEVIFHLLLQHGANIDATTSDGITALIGAVVKGWIAIIQLLLEKGANINTRTAIGQTPLMIAVKTGQEGVVQLLLGKGANIEAVDNDGRTALVLASYAGQEAIVQLLLEKGANIHTRTRDGLTPLMVAEQTGQRRVEQLLLRAS